VTQSHCPGPLEQATSLHWTICNAGCQVAFTATTVNISYANNIILQGTHMPHTWLWELDLLHPIWPPTHQCQLAIGTDTVADLVAFAHAALFSPTLSTLQEALWCHHLPEFARLTLVHLCHLPPKSLAMHQGHLDQSWQNQSSTKCTDDVTDDHFPPTPVDGHKTHACFAAIIEPLGQIYTNQTGKFPTPSSAGNNYIMVLFQA